MPVLRVAAGVCPVDFDPHKNQNKNESKKFLHVYKAQSKNKRKSRETARALK